MKKLVKKTESFEDKLFKTLTESALEFLNRAVDEFDVSPKFSTINFATAMELFFKARLLREHWSLIVEKIDTAEKQAFTQGKLQTTNPSTTLVRLKKIAGVSISDNSNTIFMNISAHRNKMVHFIHGLEKIEEKDNKTEVAIEQLRGWHEIETLLNNWREYFGDYTEEISHITAKMTNQRDFLREKFRSLESHIKDIINKGDTVTQCPSCKFVSLLSDPDDTNIKHSNCLICKHSGYTFHIPCKNTPCKHINIFNSHNAIHVHCSSCENSISKDDIIDALNTSQISYSDYFDEVNGNCPNCSSYHSVIQHHDIYACVECFEVSEELGTCEWCNENQLGGVDEYSYLSGCEFCDGRAGHEKDD